MRDLRSIDPSRVIGYGMQVAADIIPFDIASVEKPRMPRLEPIGELEFARP
jgi:hypothetical protein